MQNRTTKLLVALGGAVAVAIGIAVIVVQLVTAANTRETSADTVSVDAGTSSEPVAEVDPLAGAAVIGAVTELPPSERPTFWRVPVDAPFSTMPAATGSGRCEAGQYAWLQQHATPLSQQARMLQVQVRNTADTGSSMSIANIRADGELIDGTQVVLLQCGDVGDVGSQIIDLALDGSPGVWGPAPGWAQNPQPEGSLATLNLAPGELADLTFVFADETRAFSGRIVADLVGQQTGAVILVDAMEIESTPVPGYALRYGNGLACLKDGQYYACTPVEAEDLLREAGRS